MGKSTLSLLIDHPTEDPQAFSTRLELDPRSTQKRGGKTRAGDTYETNKWHYIVELDDSNWGSELGLLVDHLTKRKEHIAQIKDSGGRALVFFRSSSHGHVAVEVDSNLMGKMSRMGLSFGFELL